YLPIMNRIINKYLTDMDFFVNFTIDENFQETIKSRHRDEFSYNSFSEGEKSRINLSILFAWREVAKLRNSVHTNLLIFEEILDGSLDHLGSRDFMKILKTDGKDVNVFVMRHKSDTIADKFDQVVTFVKKNDFAQKVVVS